MWSNNSWKGIYPCKKIMFRIQIWHIVVLWNQSLTESNKDLWMFIRHYACQMSFDHCYKIAYIMWINKLK
jgi:hypothetical protein